ncbi:MAG: LysR family transcriptional regulator [Burkholderiales bacterium]|nr:LysR family transcriptional regulator [Burkholderiales bacterium]
MTRIRRSALHSTAYVYFESVARLGSVRKAAAELFVAPSAVSHQIRLLEDELGAPLFNRLPRGFRLSSAGETLLHHVRRGVSEIERAREFIRNLSGMRSGAASVATVEGVAVGPLAEVLEGFWARWPNVRVGVTTGSSAQAFDAVDSGAADLGLAYATPESPRARLLAQAELRVGAILRADHPLADRAGLSVRQLVDAGLPLLLADRSVGVRAMLESTLGRDALRLLPRLETNSLMMMTQLALKGVGVAVKTRIGVERELAAGALAFVPLRDLRGKSQRLRLFCREGTSLPPASQALAADLAAKLAGLHGQ